ncbi:MAG: hypothetical protein COX65_09725 [Elusimicrobia bacterium CG_4_10_14_0_2_um_filter_56_8]|nr:MAG: hypothetical protein AUJ51_09540 [Elusimicrobia bacterium CG1_02_56_21]PJA11770.1 MAG: hypothetical protein COX65_09725 [Elusimicrobia bacterium CG_4_10_14_0_2_um_filter_56_8]
MNKNIKGGAFALAAVIAVVMTALPSKAKADSHGYAWTYEYSTVWEGHPELEYYSTAVLPDSSDKQTSSWSHQLELEYGLSANTDIAMYQMFKQENTPASKTFTYDGMKLRLRHKLSEKGKLPADTLLYAEYVRGSDLSEHGALEGKLVLARDFGRLNLAYNQVVEFPLEKLSAAQHSFTAGAAWEFSDVFKGGLEARGGYRDDEYYIGPTVSFGAKNQKVWFVAGYLAGLNPDSKDAQTRLKVGMPF